LRVSRTIAAASAALLMFSVAACGEIGEEGEEEEAGSEQSEGGGEDED
jgi:hypothetical protein